MNKLNGEKIPKLISSEESKSFEFEKALLVKAGKDH